MLTGLLISHFSTLKAMIFSTEAEINAIHKWQRACGETLGEQLVPQDPVKREAGAVRRLEPSPRKASRHTRNAN